MTDSLSLDQVLNSTFDDIPEPQNCPEGDFWFRVAKVKTDVIPNDNKTPYADLTCIPTKVVNAEGVEDADLGDLYPVRGRIWLSPKAMKAARDTFRRAFQLDTEGKYISQLLDELVGMEFRGLVKHDTRGDKVYTEIARWLRPVEND